MPEPETLDGRRKKVTARDVAARAGVSVGTVSKAISGRGSVRATTKDRILAAAKELGFQSNQVAASLLSGRTHTIGVITSDQFGRLTVPVLLGAIETLADREIALLLCDGRGDPIREQHFVESLLRRRVDGILVTGNSISGRDPLSAEVPIPVVYALAWSRSDQDVSVVPDDAEGARAATRHLLATGRQRIAFISGPARDDSSQIRERAIRSELTSAGLDLITAPLFGHWTEQWGRQAAAQLLGAKVDIDGIVCGNDQLARGVVETLREKSVDVPREVGVIGFDNWDVMVEASRPALSTVDLSLFDVGHEAASALIEMIEHGGTEPGIRRLECHVVPRESTSVS